MPDCIRIGVVGARANTCLHLRALPDHASEGPSLTGSGTIGGVQTASAH
jgi:hypothetical protein